MLYPFGYGLSYTAFAISDALVKKQNGGILVTADVKNIGEMSGKEVIQIYLSKVYPVEGVERPYQELKGFEKTSDLAPVKKSRLRSGSHGENWRFMMRKEPLGSSSQAIIS